MYYTTDAYREEMRTPFRGASYVWIYIGLINQDAQRGAHITSSFSGSESYLYENSSADYQGVTSTENDGSITFTFDSSELNIAGLTMVFNTQPSTITVTNGTKTATYSVDSDEFSFDDGYENCSYIKVTPSSGKLSIKSITFGIGLQFTGKQILKTSRTNIVDHISNELPTKTYTFSIDNRLNMFNIDNPYGYANYLQEKQEVFYDYGREMSDDSIYKIKGGKVLLKSWSSDDYEAKFTCTGYIDYMTDKYYKGQYYENGESAYVVAQNVLEDAGITNYVLDDCLRKTQIFNPLPVDTHRECLKMIANACRCILYEDRDGNVCISNANRPSFVGDITFTGATDYSIPSAIFDDNSMYNYADAELEYVSADGTLLFLPENESFMQTGFVSSEIASSGGTFTNNPHIDVTFKSEYHLTRLVLNFAVVIPTSVTVTLKLDGATVSSQTITSLSMNTVYDYDGVIDAITITFNGARANQRIHLNNIALQGYLEYELTYHELKDTPTATSLDRVSRINVHNYKYYKQGEAPSGTTKAYISVTDTENEDGGITKSISTSEIADNPVATMEMEVGDNLVIFDQPCYDLSVSGGTLKESGAYYAVVESDSEQSCTISGKYFTVSDNIYTIDIHEKGVEKESSNPLIGTLTMARQQASWLRDYYDDDLEYSLIYRGDPSLDADDLIYLENKFVNLNEIRISQESLSTSTGMDFNCTLIGRRNSFQVSSTTDHAIVGRVKVGEVL